MDMVAEWLNQRRRWWLEGKKDASRNVTATDPSGFPFREWYLSHIKTGFHFSFSFNFKYAYRYTDIQIYKLTYMQLYIYCVDSFRFFFGFFFFRFSVEIQYNIRQYDGNNDMISMMVRCNSVQFNPTQKESNSMK